MKRHFITFTDSKYNKTKERISLEATNSGFFDVIHPYGESDLPEDILNYCKINKRGFGFWIWKPIIVCSHLSKMNDGDIVTYCDGGCIVNKLGEPRYKDYLEYLQLHDMVVFQTPHPECKYTKISAFNHIGIIDDLQSGQVAATAFILKKTKFTTHFINEWMDITTNHRELIDDSECSDNHVLFVDNRHDQSIFSLLCKKYKENIMFLEEEIWKSLDPLGIHFDTHFPFHGARIKF